MIEPKRDEAMELAVSIQHLHIEKRKQTAYPTREEIASLIRPHLAPRPVVPAVVEAWWHVVQEDSHTCIERFGIPGGWLYSVRRLRNDFEQVVFVPEQPK